jgi:hypothetical protein
LGVADNWIAFLSSSELRPLTTMYDAQPDDNAISAITATMRLTPLDMEMMRLTVRLTGRFCLTSSLNDIVIPTYSVSFIVFSPI